MMESSVKKKSKFILGSELLKNLKKKEKVDILEKVKEEEVPMLECLKKFFGLEDKEFLEDYLESIESKVKLIRLFIIDFTTFLKVINLKTRKYLLKPSKKKKPKIKEKKKSKKNNKQEDNRMLKKEKENLKEDYKNFKKSDK